MPFAAYGDKVKRMSVSESKLEGFWYKVPINANNQPQSKLHVTMIMEQEYGIKKLCMLGGDKKTSLATHFEQYKVDLHSQTWKHIPSEVHFNQPGDIKHFNMP
jgi:hypothetical protein